MLDTIKEFVKGVRYRMFPIATINQALGVKLAVSTPMRLAIQRWSDMFETKTGLNLPAAIAGEIARLTTIENQIDITGSQRADFLSEQFEPVRAQLRSQVEFGIATGGLIFKPYLDGKRVAVSYVKADSFYPSAFDSRGRMTGAVFIDEILRDDKLYRRLEYHHLEPSGCVIENKAFVTSPLTRTVLGEPIALDRVEEWATLEPTATVENVDRLLLGYFRVPLANTVDPSSPLGVSGYSRADSIIQQADEQWTRILWEYEGTELAVHADETMFPPDDCGKRKLPAGKERIYRLVVGDIAPHQKMELFSPDIRDTPLFNGLNNMLKRIEFQCSLAYGTISDPQNVDKTAEEIKASKQRSFSVVRDTQKALQAALDDLIYAMDIWTSIGALAPAGRYAVAYDWDDSIISDPSERKKMFWQYVVAGKFPFWRYLVDFEGYSEADAREIDADTGGAMGDPYAIT